ncbi:MAG: TolC family protein [Prevotella sp.]
MATETWGQKVWTLDDCIGYALQHSATVMKSRVAADNARQDRGVALGGFMPSVTGSVSGQFSWGRNVDPETNTYNTITTFSNGYSASGSVTLFDGLRTWNEFRKARLAVKRSDNALELTKDEKEIEVMERYMDAVYNKAALRIAEDKLADSRSLLVKTRRMEELGVKSYPDVAQVEAQMAEDEYSLERQKTAAEKAVVELKRAIGIDLGEEMLIDSTLTFRAQGHGYGQEIGRGIAAERIMEAESALASARFDYKIACGMLFPSLTVGGGIGTSYYKNLSAGATGTSFSRQMKDNLGEYIYASLSIPLFNFSTYKKIKKARNNVRLAEIEREETVLNVNSDYRQAVLDRDGYIKEAALMERKVASDSIAHHLNTRKYEEGMLSTFDLHTSAQTLHDSRVKLLQTRLMAEIKKRLVEYYEN